ncbi:MAG TPA: hypothetical protein VHF88_00650 [Thermoleophilaceae bacterium]|nr:hypothetical protein [Thermoleophilaceae bacterium]
MPTRTPPSRPHTAASRPVAPPLARLRARAGDSKHLPVAQTAIVALLLGLIATVVYGPHAIHGGFLSDAWAARTLYEFAPQDDFLGRLGHLLSQPNVSPRPLQGVYVAVQNAVFGPHMGLWLTWQGAMSVVMSLVLYLLLRELRFSWQDAGAIAVLVLIFPAASSIRLWTAPMSALTISLALLGFLLALRAFRRDGARRIALHGLSLAVFAASLLLYEVALSAMLASVLVYRLCVPWRAAGARWLVDVVVLVPLAALVTRSESSSWEAQTFDGMWRHATVFWDEAQTLLTSVVLPFGTDRWYALALIALIPAIAVLLARQLPSSDPARADLRRWLLTVLAGLAIVALGYAMFVPAMDYYTPLRPGIANRINAVPSIGWVLVLYGLAMLAATIAFRGQRQRRLGASALALVACAIVAASWLESIDREAEAYMRAYSEGERVLQTVETLLPDPPPHSVIWTFGQPVEIAPGIPVFGNTWDMTGSVQLMYDDPTITSYVGHPGTTFDCERERIVAGGPAYLVPSSPGAQPLSSPYGPTYFVDTVDGRLQRIRSRAECRRARVSFELSPALAPA